MSDSTAPSHSLLKEIAELVAFIGKWGILFIGGFCLMLYANEIGGFPEGVQLGEGLAFYMVSAGFLMAYGFYSSALIALGCIFMRWPLQRVERFFLHRPAWHTDKPQGPRLDLNLPTDFSSMWDSAVWGGAVLGFILFGVVSSTFEVFGHHLVVAIFEGAIVGLLLVSRRRQRLLETGLASADWRTQTLSERRNGFTVVQRALVLILIMAPLLLGASQLALVDAGFRIAQLRKENAIVQIRKPWSQRLIEHGKTSTQSFLGEDYVQVEGVKVLLRSLGSKVIVELPAFGSLPARSFPIPAEAIVVE